MLKETAFIMLAVTALAACNQGQAERVAQASVTRSVSGDFSLVWDAPVSAPVDVYVANAPYAPAAARRLAIDNDRDGRASLDLAAAPRPYFFVAADRGDGVWTAERVLPLEGGRNFRDLGGYRTVDGKQVRWGVLYRSGNPANLTAADFGYLARLGIRSVCDLRTNAERKSEPNRWAQTQAIAYWTRDYAVSSANLDSLVANEYTKPEEVKASMADVYRKLPFDQAPGYREIFRQLATGDVPLAFNCTAGKDRTGVGAALILSALGVPRETVLADYALSDKVVDYRKIYSGEKLAALGPMAKLPVQSLDALFASDPEYLRATFAAIEGKYGSVDVYLRRELGLDESQLEAIRRKLLI